MGDRIFGIWETCKIINIHHPPEVEEAKLRETLQTSKKRGITGACKIKV